METENEKEQDEALRCICHCSAAAVWCENQRLWGHKGLLWSFGFTPHTVQGTEPPLSRAVLVAPQQQGLFQPELGFHMDLKWVPFSVLALICLCVYLCVYLYVLYICIYMHTSLCVHVCGQCICTIVCPESFFQAGVQPIWSTIKCFTNDESYLCTSSVEQL